MHTQYKLHVFFSLQNLYSKYVLGQHTESKYYATYALRHLVFKTHMIFKLGSTVLSVLTIRHYVKCT